MTRSLQALKTVLVAGLILSLPLVCRGADDGYGYPPLDSYTATIAGTPPKLKPDLPAEVPLRKIVLDVIPGVRKPDIFFYDEGLKFSAAFQKGKAPLVFLIPGTGADVSAPRLLGMMRFLYGEGYHVVALPNPTHPNFIISASRSHVPGDLTEDAADIYTAMERIMAEVKGDVEVTDYYLGGYSLGGTQAAFVAKLDEERKRFNFRRVIMINPAVNLYTSVCRIENLLKNIPGGPRKIGAFFTATVNKFVEFYRQGDFIALDDQFLYATYKSNLLSHDDEGGVIATAFRINLAGMIFASDVMTNGGYIVPKNRQLMSNDRIGDYFLVGLHIPFTQYFDEYFYPYFRKQRPGLTREALIEAEGLRSIEGYLRSTDKIGVVTNEDDFILDPADLTYLRQLFGERAHIYPRGGHLGNSEYRENLVYIADFIKKLGVRPQ